MAALFTRSLLSKPAMAVKTINSIFTRSFQSVSSPSSSSGFLRALRPLSSAFNAARSHTAVTVRSFSSRRTDMSLNDPSPNFSNRPPKETILLDGCDFEHWLVVLEKPEGDPTRDEIIDRYIKTLAQVVGSEEEARFKIYSVSTRCYYAFGALVSEEVSNKIKELPGVRWVLPDSYLDVRNKDYGGEPFIDGKAVPYDPKYHEEWIRNNAKANERNRRNDRPRNFDRSRNFERRRENMQNREFRDPAQPIGMSQPNMGPPPPPPPPSGAMGGQQNNFSFPGGAPPPPPNRPPHNFSGVPGGPPHNFSGVPGGPPPPNSPPNFSGVPGGPPPPPPSNNYMGGHPNNIGGPGRSQQPPLNNSYMGGGPPNMSGGPQNAGWQQNFQHGPNPGGMPYQGAPSDFQNPNMHGGN